jgi:thiol-disulfide isomerase/thioredoxin
MTGQRAIWILAFIFLVLAANNSLALDNKGRALSAEDWHLELIDNQGVSHRLQDYKNRIIWLDFWASWCVPCRHEFPWLARMQEKYQRQGFQVLAVNLDEDAGDMQRFLQRYPANFPVIHDPEGKLAERFQVQGMPMGILIGRDGRVMEKHVGFRKKDAQLLEQKIKATL